MGGGCTGICHTFKGAHKNGGKGYKHGYVRCTQCALFFDYEGNFCPCCSNRIRRKSRYQEEKVRIG